MFKHILVLILFIALSVTVFGQRRVWTGYSVYNTVLSSSSLTPAKSVIILDQLEIENHSSGLVEAIKSGNEELIYFYTKTSNVDSATLNLIVDYYENQSEQSLEAKRFYLPVDVIMTNKTALDKMFNPLVEKGWKDFNKKYPKSAGLFQFSRVHFSKDVKRAVFYFSRQQSVLKGYGELVIMESVNNTWKVKYRFNLWRS